MEKKKKIDTNYNKSECTRFIISFFCQQNANSPYYGHVLGHLSPSYSREIIFVRCRILAFPGVSSCSGIL